MLIGVISDTHRRKRPEALAALQGSDQIIHAGDVGDPEILDSLISDRSGYSCTRKCRSRVLGQVIFLKPTFSKLTGFKSTSCIFSKASI